MIRNSHHIYILLFCGFLILNPVASPASNDWPVNQCAAQDYWLEFAELDLCLEKSKVISLNYLNLSEPSAVIRFQIGGKNTIEFGMSRLDDDQITGGLHHHLGRTPQQLFEQLSGKPEAEKSRVDLIRKVLDVDNGTVVRHYRRATLDAYALVRPITSDSSVYLFDSKRNGGIEISGRLSGHDIEYILSRIRW